MILLFTVNEISSSCFGPGNAMIGINGNQDNPTGNMHEFNDGDPDFIVSFKKVSTPLPLQTNLVVFNIQQSYKPNSFLSDNPTPPPKS